MSLNISTTYRYLYYKDQKAAVPPKQHYLKYELKLLQWKQQRQEHSLSSHLIAVVTPLPPLPPPSPFPRWMYPLATAWRKQQQAASEPKEKASSSPISSSIHLSFIWKRLFRGFRILLVLRGSSPESERVSSFSSSWAFAFHQAYLIQYTRARVSMHSLIVICRPKTALTYSIQINNFLFVSDTHTHTIDPSPNSSSSSSSLPFLSSLRWFYTFSFL